MSDSDLPPPGMVAKYEIKGTTYDEMEAVARAVFAGLFDGRDWAFLGAQIEPEEEEAGFGTAPRVNLWRGQFFAITTSGVE